MGPIAPGCRLYAPTVAAFKAGEGRHVKALPGGRVSPEAVLTYPRADLQGDVVEPGGLDLWEFENTYENLSNFEHGAYIGTTAVEFKSVPRLDANGQPDEQLGLIALPVGVTTFFDSAASAARHTLRRFDNAGRVTGVYPPDECAALAEQVSGLVPGVYGGVSLEFRPAGPEGTAFKAIGAYRDDIGRRPCHFFKANMLGLASACELPVNRFAGYVTASDEVMEKAEKALKVCESPSTLAVIRKSLSWATAVLKASPTNRVTVPVRRDPPMSKTATKPATKPGRTAKAFPEDEMPVDDVAPVGDTPPLEEPAPASPDMKPTPAALFQIAQGLMDLCDQAEAMGEAGEHPKGLKLLAKHCQTARAMAAKIKADAESVAADVGGGEMADDYDTPEEADPVETDDDTGVIESKAFAGRWRPARFVKAGTPYTSAHLRKKAKPTTDPETEKLLDWALNRIEEQKAQLRAAGLRAD